MKIKTLSYYIRKKLQHQFVQMELLEPDKFVRLLVDHGIHIKERDLELFEKEGLLQPLFRFRVPLSIRKKGTGLLLGTDVMQWYYKNTNCIEFPRRGDYQQWKRFQRKYTQDSEHYDKKLIFYHPFQLLQIENILDYQKFHFMYRESYKNKELLRILKNIRREKQHRKQFLNTSPLGQIEKIGLLMLLEESYRFHAFGKISIPSSFDSKRNSFEKWVKWKKKNFSAQKLLSISNLDVEQVKQLYDWLAIHALHIDPLEHWYDLTRIMKPNIIKKLKGEALKAQFYYELSRLVGLFLYDLKQKVDEPDLFFDETKGEWKNKIYGSTKFDYTSKETQRGIIRYFIRDTNTNALLLVEGETEVKIINSIFEKLSVNAKNDGINIVNYDGISNLVPKRLQHVIQLSNSNNIPIFIIADNECNAIEKIQKIKGDIISKIDHHVWKKSLEEDNFGLNKVIDLVNNYLKKHGKVLTKTDVKEKQKQGHSLIRAIELVYREKFHADIYAKIPHKPDLCLELIKNRLKYISRSKKIGKQLPIEEVLHRFFRFIARWESA